MSRLGRWLEQVPDTLRFRGWSAGLIETICRHASKIAESVQNGLDLHTYP
jgi:hypothetical protein